MQQEFQIQVSPEIAANSEEFLREVSASTGIPAEEIRHIEILKSSLDARQRMIKMNLLIRVFINEDFEDIPVSLPDYPDVSHAQPVIIVGAGPGGLFAALQCLEKGIKPIILERGKDVHARVADLKAININHLVNEDSNYCFGEGGAGTYSDGKLFTRTKKRGDVSQIIKLFVAFGADKKIIVDAHPHIGTNKLPGIIKNIRECILEHGGEIHFNTRVVDIIVKNQSISGVITMSGDKYETGKLILATGHSARDIYELLFRKEIAIELKPFAMGVRVEHQQSLIDRIQYKRPDRGAFLPPAAYNIVRQINGRGVFSFCMCPGGVIAPCATQQGEVVTNGWSPSKRDHPSANSGIVVELKPDDFKSFSSFGPLAALEFQKAVEQKACMVAGSTQKVPAQRLQDFVNGKISKDLPLTSYKPGIVSADMKSVFPEFIVRSLQLGFVEFGKAMKGFLTNDAVIHAPESRTSSPVRIPRDPESLEHIAVKGLYPCGEGAGYAGGIISAALDGIRCAEKCIESL
ncbi:MAG TPA: NAD(P)/FAD-dependent oxidoreductase [Bacteroidales bacterium]|nr:NAD(P)/FAD-dependent oxidoreductase [Bacteroidales bacterium]